MTTQTQDIALPDFASPADLQAFTKGKIQAADDRVSVALAAVSNSIRSRAEWHIWPRVTDHAVRLDGPGGTTLNLPTMKLNNLVSITEGDTPLTPLDDVVDWSEIGLVKRQDGGHWTDRYRRIQVVMDHGWEAAPELKQLALTLVARGLASPMGATREQAGSLSVNWAMAVQGVSGGLIPLSDELSVMERYRRVSV